MHSQLYLWLKSMKGKVNRRESLPNYIERVDTGLDGWQVRQAIESNIIMTNHEQ